MKKTTTKLNTCPLCGNKTHKIGFCSNFCQNFYNQSDCQRPEGVSQLDVARERYAKMQ